MKMTTSRVGRRRAVDNNALQPVIRLLLFPQLRGHPGPATILKRIVLRTTVFSQRRTRESPNTTIIQAALSPLSLSFYRLPPLSSYMLFFWKTFKEPDRIVYVRSRAATRQMFGVVLAGLALILMPPNLVQHSAAFRRAAEQVPVLFFGPLRARVNLRADLHRLNVSCQARYYDFQDPPSGRHDFVEQCRRNHGCYRSDLDGPYHRIFGSNRGLIEVTLRASGRFTESGRPASWYCERKREE